ncbi:hypothetical protein BJV77DRAFT_1066963 [Russula vinacea]|nr:hypothetical protein BJV77DRAFT_1066963 [Russula vinacea]
MSFSFPQPVNTAQHRPTPLHSLPPTQLSLPPSRARLYTVRLTVDPHARTFATLHDVSAYTLANSTDMMEEGYCSPSPAPQKQSPHKRRSGGRNSSRRCWRDPDDGDATYPAKRTRINRTTAMLLSDDGSPGNDGADVADVDGSEEGKRLLRGD